MLIHLYVSIMSCSRSFYLLEVCILTLYLSLSPQLFGNPFFKLSYFDCG